MSQTEKNIRKRVPIRRRVMTIVLMTTLVALLAASITGIICIQWIRNSSEAILTEQLKDNLKNTVQEKAISADAMLEHYEKYIVLVTDYIQNMYLHEDEMISRGHMFRAPRDTKEYEMTRMLASEKVSAEDLRDEILFFSNLEQVWGPIAKENEDLITTVYAGTTNGLLPSYDRWGFLSAVPAGQESYYNYFESEWYRQGMKEDGVFYTGLYVDSQGRGLTITVGAPFRNAKGEFAGVDCADFDITAMYREMLDTRLGDGTFSFALDQDGSVISMDDKDLSPEEKTGLPEEKLKALASDPDGFLETEDSVYVCTPIQRLGWTLCACVSKEVFHGMIHESERSVRYAYLFFILIAVLIIILVIFTVNKVAETITRPIEHLGEDMKIIADGDLDYRATSYRNDEIGDVTERMNEMVENLKSTMKELSSTQQHADAMSRLATRDSLTGIRNKTSFDEHMVELKQRLEDGHQSFGFVMVDLNNLKVINDTYGHGKGNEAICGLSDLICEVFAHSPVFRVGGDEFTVILEGKDYENIDDLVSEFHEKMQVLSSDTSLNPWRRTSAAIGYACYDEAQDTGADSVLSRADMEMYRCKRRMEDE